MLEILPQSEGSLMCFKASIILTEEDYENVFQPAMEDLLAREKTFRLYLDLSELDALDETSRWETGDILARHRNRCERAVVIGGPSWAGLALLLRDSLPDEAFEFFVDGRQNQAFAWLTES